MVTIYQNKEPQYVFILQYNLKWKMINMRGPIPQKMVVSVKLMLHLLQAYEGEEISITPDMVDVVSLSRDVLRRSA